MKLSVFTDASVDNTNSTGGYAFYIGCVKGMIKKAGILKGPIINATQGELSCIANAIHTLKYCKFKPITSVVVYSDLLHAVQLMNGDARSFKNKELRDIVDQINFLMLEVCIQEKINIRQVKTFFTFKHVNAHTGRKDKLSIINNWCDQEAVKYRKKALNKKMK